MKKYLFIKWDVARGTSRRVLFADTYEAAYWACGIAGFPPSVIWTIEPIA